MNTICKKKLDFVWSVTRYEQHVGIQQRDASWRRDYERGNDTCWVFQNSNVFLQHHLCYWWIYHGTHLLLVVTSMIVFLIPVRHHEGVKDYEQIWGLLNNTLMSLAAQDCHDWHAIVCASKVLPIASVLPQRKISFLEHVGSRICFNPPKWSQLDVEAHILDKAERRRVCAESCRKRDLRPTWYFIADADDYIANNLVSTILATTEPRHSVVTLDTGIMLDTHNQSYLTVDNFHNLCGTSIAIHASLVDSVADSDEHSNTLLGQPRFPRLLAGQYCRYPNRHSLSGLPRAAYTLHDQNYGRSLWDHSEHLAVTEPLTPEIRQQFTLPVG